MPYFKDSIYNEQGLTLIEVLASLVLLSLLTVSILGIFTSTAKWVAKARQETTASNYASAVLEDLRLQRQIINNDNEGLLAEELLPGYGYPWEGMDARITTMEDLNPLHNLYNITVTIFRSGDTQSPILQMSTIMRKE